MVFLWGLTLAAFIFVTFFLIPAAIVLIIVNVELDEFQDAERREYED